MFARTQPWPDAFDLFAIGVMAVLLIGAPLVGYVILYVDYRRYLASLKRGLMVVRKYATGMPEWVRRDSPPCLQALGLQMPVTREQVLAAYRQRVKHVHPDRMGDDLTPAQQEVIRKRFATLQRHFEDALSLTEPE